MAAASAVMAATVQQVVMNGNDVSTVINNINSLYTNALNQIIALTVGLLAVGGVVLPLIIAYFQKRKSTTDYEALSENISREMQEAKTALIAEIRNDLKTELELLEEKLSEMKNEMKSDIQKNRALADAKAHHLQINHRLQQKDFGGAFTDCVEGITQYAFAKAERHMQILINVFANTVIQNLKKVQLDEINDMQKRFDIMVESIELLNENGRYTEQIMLLKNGLKDALAR